MAPDTIYNGIWEYAPNFKHDAQWRTGAAVTNIANHNGVLTAADGATGVILWPMKTPYQFVGGTLTAAGDGYVFEVGFLDPKDWRKTIYTPLATLAEFDGIGFTIHDEPYVVKLGDTKELTNPFPANFVAQVPGTALDVVGVGNVLPNANRAYYRVVAVDSKGRRSGDSDYAEAPRPFIYSTPTTTAPAGQPYRYQVKVIRSIGDLTRRDAAKPKPGARFWKIEPLKFSLTEKPSWMSINADTGLVTGISDGTGGAVTVSVTLTKEHRLVHDKDNIVWGNEYEQSKTYEVVGPVTQKFVVSSAKSE
jgi:hypothetical protein